MGSIFSYDLNNNLLPPKGDYSGKAEIPSKISSCQTLKVPYNSYIFESSTVPVVMTHGLGTFNPKLRSHLNDPWLSDVIVEGAVKAKISYISYTSRGHGESEGWQVDAEKNLEQFEWRKLSSDMFHLAKCCGANNFIAAGSSMGSATALYTAIHYPDNVKAIILIRPPTSWEERKNRRIQLISNAEKCKLANPDDLGHFVLLGTSYSDLPPKKSTNIYSNIKCPVLILAVKGDDAHPLSTAYELSKLLKQSVLHIADTVEYAKSRWPAVISNFLSEI